MSPYNFAVFLLFALNGYAATFQQGSGVQGLLRDRSLNHLLTLPATDVITDVISSPIAQMPEIDNDNQFVRNSLSGTIQQTLDLIKNVETLPSCAKIASSALLHSCSALEGSIKHDESELARGSDLFIEEEADIYSARLAVCELSGADFSIPPPCRSFVPAAQTSKKRGIRAFWSKDGPTQPTGAFQYYDEITITNLQHCRKALGSTSQSWTSYSNNRQNAVVMCRAMRSEIERDEQLHVGKILAKAAATATGSLQDAFETANLLKSQFTELATAIPQFQQDLVAGNQQQMDYIRDFWIEVEQLRGGLRNILQDFDSVQHGLQASKSEVVDLGAAIRNAALESTANMRSAAAQTQHELTALSDNAAALSEVGGYMLEMFKQDIVKALYNAGQDIGAINAIMPAINREVISWREANQRMHEESLAKHAENQAYLNQTAATLEQFQLAATEMNATIASITGFVGLGWPGALKLAKTAGTFAGYASFYSLISFAFWEKYAGFYFSGTVAASVATGSGKISFISVENVDYANITTASAYISTFKTSPLDIYTCVSDHISTTIIDQQLALGALIGVLTCLIFAAVAAALRRATRRDDCFGKYDPASPPHSATFPTDPVWWEKD